MVLSTWLVTWAPRGEEILKVSSKTGRETGGHSEDLVFSVKIGVIAYLVLTGEDPGVHLFISFPLPQADNYVGSSAVLLRHFSMKFVFSH